MAQQEPLARSSGPADQGQSAHAPQQGFEGLGYLLPDEQRLDGILREEEGGPLLQAQGIPQEIVLHRVVESEFPACPCLAVEQVRKAAPSIEIGLIRGHHPAGLRKELHCQAKPRPLAGYIVLQIGEELLIFGVQPRSKGQQQALGLKLIQAVAPNESNKGELLHVASLQPVAEILIDHLDLLNVLLLHGGARR